MESQERIRNDCEEAIHKIYHFLDGELTQEKRVEITKHLDECPPCGKAFDFEADLRRVISSSCHDRVPDSLRERIANSIKHEISKSE